MKITTLAVSLFAALFFVGTVNANPAPSVSSYSRGAGIANVSVRGQYHGYHARPRTSIGISFYGGGSRFSYRSEPYYGAPHPYYSYYCPPVYSGPIYVPPPVVYMPPPVVYPPSAVYPPPVRNQGRAYSSAGDDAFVRGNDVARAQDALQQLGYYKGGIDGLYGPGTRAAVRAFQVDRGLSVSGRVDTETMEALGF